MSKKQAKAKVRAWRSQGYTWDQITNKLQDAMTVFEEEYEYEREQIANVLGEELGARFLYVEFDEKQAEHAAVAYN